MRIAVWHNLPSGGGKRALYDQVRGLLSRGHEIEVWCPPTADRAYLPLSEVVPEHVVPLSLKAPAPLLQKIRPGYWSAHGRMKAMDRHCMECAGQINAGGFDLLFAGPCLFFLTPRIARFSKIPSVLYLQEPNRPFYEASPVLPWVAGEWSARNLFDPQFLKQALVRRLKLSRIRVWAREERHNALAFDRILVNSFFSRESVLRALGVNSSVCYLGIDNHRFVNQNKKRESFAVCVASFSPNKNMDFLVRSLALVPEGRRPKLYVVSNIVYPSYLDAMRDLARSLGVDFELKHRIEDAELIDLLNRARMMLYAPRLEPFGLAPLEANCCGLPVIAVAEGGVRETVEDRVNGLLVDPEPESMAWAIEQLASDDQLFLSLSRGAYQLAQKKWSLELSIDRLEKKLNAVKNAQSNSRQGTRF